MRYVALIAVSVLLISAVGLALNRRPVEPPPLHEASTPAPAPPATTTSDTPADIVGVLTASRIDEISAPFAGRVEHLAVSIGASVAAGDVLAVLAPDADVMSLERTAAEEARLAELAHRRARLELERAEAKRRNAELLVEQGLSPRAALDESRFEFSLAEMALASADQVLEMRRLARRSLSDKIAAATITASCACIVTSVDRSEGMRVGEHDVVLRLARAADLRVRFLAADGAGFHPGGALELSASPQAAPERGHIVSISPMLLDGAGQTVMEARPDRPEDAGSIARLRIGAQVWVRRP